MKRNRLLLFLGLVLVFVATGIRACSPMKQKAAANEKADPKTFKTAPDVTFKGLDGKEISLTSLKGKVVVVNFWATWCEPCQIEIPVDDRISEEIRRQGLHDSRRRYG